MNRVTHFFVGADLRCQHDGLALLAAKKGVSVSKLKEGNHVIFVNNSKNKIKMYSPGGVLSYMKSDRRLDLQAVGRIPQTFGKSIELKYKGALKSRIEKTLKQSTY